MRFETLAVHAADRRGTETGGVAPAIHLSTTFRRAEDGSFPSGFTYIRDDNPNRADLETALAAIENGDAAVAFGSGMAATNAVFQALSPGDHVVAPMVAYFGTPKLLREHFVRWGLEVTFADMTDPSAISAAARPGTKVIWIESPSNPLISVTDISAVVAIAAKVGARVVCDNTWATPYLQRPLDFGADLVMHSTTKYLSGHSDAMGGAIVGREGDPLLARIKRLQVDAGAVPSPFDSWLVLRGIRTLPWRMRAHSATAGQLAHFLAGHRKVERVHYPGLDSDPGHSVAKRQMRDFGGMVSVVVPGGRERAFEVAGRLRVTTPATSLGGPESLVEHRASVEGPATKAPEGLLRISVGLEHPDDLIADWEQALD